MARKSPRAPESVAVAPPPAEVRHVKPVAKSLLRFVGSLQVAVVALSVLIVVLAVGTEIESVYTGRLAQDLIYHTWWFQGLMGLLFFNILFAALKKWPWKRHQLGFLVTHLGLLTLIIGGVVNSLTGTDALLSLVSSDRPDLKAYAPQASQLAHFIDDSTIAVELGSDRKRTAYDFEPGLLPWHADTFFTPERDPLLHSLDYLAHPLPRGWSQTLPNGMRLEVLNFYPHTRPEPFAPTEADNGQPAVKVQFGLVIPAVGQSREFDRWLVAVDDDDADRMPLKTTLVGIAKTAGQVEEFLRPPPLATLGSRGQIALWFDGELFRIKVDPNGPTVPLGVSGWTVRVVDYLSDLKAMRHDGLATRPTVRLEFRHGDGRTASGFALGRRPAGLFVMPADKDDPLAARAAEDVNARAAAFFHVADLRFGGQESGVVQLMSSANGQLHYRSFHRVQEIGFEREAAGSIPLKDTTTAGVMTGTARIPVLSNVQGSMRVLEYIPKAAQERRYVPESRRPGLDSATVGLEPAIRCRLSKGSSRKEFWVGKTTETDRFRTVTLDGEPVRVGFHVKALDLGFELKLQRAEQTGDPGTQSAATYTSYVLLNDRERSLNSAAQVITMNEPLDHRGYKFFQSGLNNRLPPDDDGKPVALSTFTVSRDPGLGLKYLGSVMLAVGILLMFTMKAYTMDAMKRYWGSVIRRGAGSSEPRA